jgi:hypothetical protein
VSTITFELPAFRTHVNDARALELQLQLDDPDGPRHYTHAVSLRSLVMGEAHTVRSIYANERMATELRALANDLDALAHAWKPAPREPGDDTRARQVTP